MEPIKPKIGGALVGVALGLVLTAFYNKKINNTFKVTAPIFGALAGYQVGSKCFSAIFPKDIKKNTEDREKLFISSFSLLFSPPKEEEINQRRLDLAEHLECGRQLIPLSWNRPEKGKEGSLYGSSAWEESLPDVKERLKPLSYQQKGALFPLWPGLIESPKDPLECDRERGLLIFTASKETLELWVEEEECTEQEKLALEGRKFAVLGAPIKKNNHFTLFMYDPVKKKYVYFDNLQLQAKEDDLLQRDRGSLSPAQLLPGGLFSGGGLIALDLELLDSVLNPKDWEGLNWVTPKWQDMNCYLAVSWLITAYKIRVADILKKTARDENK
ncbi:MAG: hypothetical protein JSR80_03110 [Verrucomicrobia bacterium]|nr:hypothetical protein [Verrucomicrobiota bacterium]